MATAAWSSSSRSSSVITIPLAGFTEILQVGKFSFYKSEVFRCMPINASSTKVAAKYKAFKTRVNYIGASGLMNIMLEIVILAKVEIRNECTKKQYLYN